LHTVRFNKLVQNTFLNNNNKKKMDIAKWQFSYAERVKQYVAK